MNTSRRGTIESDDTSLEVQPSPHTTMKNNPFDPLAGQPSNRPKEQDQFQDLQATHLLCPKCGRATPTREHLLLVLPQGALYEYRCSVCNTSVGTRESNS